MLKKHFDEKRFNREYSQFFPVIFRVAYRITGDTGSAEDLCHEAFIKYCEREEMLPDSDQAKYWLIRVVKNLALNHAKRKQRERHALGKLEKITRPYSESAEKGLLKAETVSQVQAALAKLPLKLRMVLVLKEYGELNYQQIGRIMGITEGNVKVRVFRAREQLEKLLKDER